MKKTIITCDVCKEEKECEVIRLSFNRTGADKMFDICKECCIKAKLFETSFPRQYQSIPTTAEQLVELLQEIARNAVQE